MWVYHPNPQFWPVWHFLQQPSSKLLLLVWFLVISITLVCDHQKTSSLPCYQAGLTTESYKHLLTDLLLELSANLFFAPGPIYFFSWTKGTKVHPLDMVGHTKERRLRQCAWWSRLRHGCRRALACSGHYARLLPPRLDLKPCPGARPCSTLSPCIGCSSWFAINAPLEQCPCHAQPLTSIRALLKLASDAPEPPRSYIRCQDPDSMPHRSSM